jgi:hypothetical protein
MPPKLRELRARLRKAGFAVRPGDRLVLAGRDGQDAEPYQEREVAAVLEKVAALEEEGQ